MRILIAFTLALFVCLPVWSAEVGQPAPSFSLPELAGHSQTLEQLRGKLVYVDFWASWCGSCRQSFPFMNDFAQRYPDKLVVLAINLDEKRSDAEAFLAKYPASFTVLFDPKGDVAARYDLKGMPSSFLIDQAGVIKFAHVGFRENTAMTISNELNQLLK
jgi:thiol-disulfide isomerase/thioredoxin